MKEAVTWLVAFALVLCTAWLAYELGSMRGRKRGYQQCLGEQDDDRPRYAVGGGN